MRRTPSHRRLPILLLLLVLVLWYTRPSAVKERFVSLQVEPEQDVDWIRTRDDTEPENVPLSPYEHLLSPEQELLQRNPLDVKPSKEHLQNNGHRRKAKTKEITNVPPQAELPKQLEETAPQEQAYIVIVDGIIFELQGGSPKGISMVWKNVMPELAKQFTGNSKLVFLDRTPHSGISQHISKQPHVHTMHLTMSVEDAIEKEVLKGYRWEEKSADGSGPKKKTTEQLEPERPIVIFMSTYYTEPKLHGVCNVLMYHDLIPERVGMYAGPGSEYYPRIDMLDRVNSIVSVSHSTSRDILDLYGPKVTKLPSDEFYDKRPPSQDASDDEKLLHNTILSTTPNRINRDVFPGPATRQALLAFRKKYGIWESTDSVFEVEGVPVDYFTLVGASHSYKNHPSFFAALDLVPDEFLERISFVLVGRGYPSDVELEGIQRHPVLISTGSSEETKEFPAKTQKDASHTPIRINVLSFVEDADMPTLYSGALALVHTSSYEGFGLPLAEAMTSGTLGVVTDASSLPEVGGPPDITTYIQDPKDPQQVADGMVEVLRLTPKQRQQRVQRALKWVERYGGGGQGGIGHGWDEMAKLIAQHIRGTKHRGEQCYRSPWVEQK